MKKNVFFTYLTKHYDEDNNFDYYELHYKIVLQDGKYAKKWDPILNPISRNRYEITLPNNPPKVHTIELETSNGLPDHNVALDGIIQITGIQPAVANGSWHKLAVSLKLKGGPIGGNGSTIHLGDAD